MFILDTDRSSENTDKGFWENPSMVYRYSFYFLVILTGFLVNPIAAHAQSDKAERKPGEVVEVEIAKGMKLKFCWIPAGAAMLGSPANDERHEADEDEHKFQTKGFWLGKYDVTQEEWTAVMGKNPSHFVPTQADVKRAGITDTSRFPVEKVTWNDCQEFMKTLNVSVKLPSGLGKGKLCLPHEDEWEYAARGGKGNEQPFYFGNELNGKQANCAGHYPYGTETKGPFLIRTTAVGSYEKVAKHPWGLCDMHGNVWQMCDNWDGSEQKYRARGGSWGCFARYCRAAIRINEPRYAELGCRVCFRLEASITPGGVTSGEPGQEGIPARKSDPDNTPVPDKETVKVPKAPAVITSRKPGEEVEFSSPKPKNKENVSD